MALTFSCQDVEIPALGSDSQWIQFQTSTLTVSESEPFKKIPVLYAADTNPNGIEVNFTYTATSTEGYTLSPSNGVVTIPAGEFIGYITITPINDDVTNEDVVFNFSLENNSIPIGIAGQGIYNTTIEVTLVEDDCPLDLSQFVGTYTAEEDDYCVGCYEVSVTLNETDQVLVLSNLYDTGGTTVIALDNSDPANPTIDFQSRLYNAALQVNSQYGNVWATNPSSISGNGPEDDLSTFRTCSQYMDLYFWRCVSVGCFTSGVVHIQLYKN